jgi:hypothetical protein
MKTEEERKKTEMKTRSGVEKEAGNEEKEEAKQETGVSEEGVLDTSELWEKVVNMGTSFMSFEETAPAAVSSDDSSDDDHESVANKSPASSKSRKSFLSAGSKSPVRILSFFGKKEKRAGGPAKNGGTNEGKVKETVVKKNATKESKTKENKKEETAAKFVPKTKESKTVDRAEKSTPAKESKTINSVEKSTPTKESKMLRSVLFGGWHVKDKAGEDSDDDIVPSRQTRVYKIVSVSWSNSCCRLFLLLILFWFARITVHR